MLQETFIAAIIIHVRTALNTVADTLWRLRCYF